MIFKPSVIILPRERLTVKHWKGPSQRFVQFCKICKYKICEAVSSGYRLFSRWLFLHFLSHQVAPKGPLEFCESGYIQFGFRKTIYLRCTVMSMNTLSHCCAVYMLSRFSQVWIFCNTMDCCSLPGSSVHGILQQKYWSGLLCPPRGDHPDPGSKTVSPTSPVLAGKCLTTKAT